MTPHQRLSRLEEFWGYGDPDKASVLFIGIEEGGQWNPKPDQSLEQCIDDSISRSNKPYSPKEEWADAASVKSLSRLELMQAYIALRLNHGDRIINMDADFRCRQVQEYCRGEFGETEAFQANLYPIPCRNNSAWDTALTKALGITETKMAYRTKVLDKRLEVLKALLGHISSPEKRCKTIIMGKSDIWDNQEVWPQVHAALFPNCKFQPSDNSYQIDDSHSIALLRHPAYTRWFSMNYINNVLNQLKG